MTRISLISKPIPALRYRSGSSSQGDNLPQAKAGLPQNKANLPQPKIKVPAEPPLDPF